MAEGANVRSGIPEGSPRGILAIRRTTATSEWRRSLHLLKVMVDPDTPASTRVRAADSILDHGAKAIEIEDIEVRVAELERAAEATKLSRS